MRKSKAGNNGMVVTVMRKRKRRMRKSCLSSLLPRERHLAKHSTPPHSSKPRSKPCTGVCHPCEYQQPGHSTLQPHLVPAHQGIDRGCGALRLRHRHAPLFPLRAGQRVLRRRGADHQRGNRARPHAACPGSAASGRPTGGGFSMDTHLGLMRYFVVLFHVQKISACVCMPLRPPHLWWVLYTFLGLMRLIVGLLHVRNMRLCLHTLATALSAAALVVFPSNRHI